MYKDTHFFYIYKTFILFFINKAFPPFFRDAACRISMKQIGDYETRLAASIQKGKKQGDRNVKRTDIP